MSTLDRRTLLKSGLAAATLPAFFGRLSFAATTDRILVLVQLDGGNDGLNTVIPFADDAYHRARPGIGVPPGQVLRLDDHVALHPQLQGLRTVWDNGDLAILQGVGYPNPNRSHFTSTDIWHTASTRTDGRWNGWAGRALDRCARDDVPGVHLDPGPLSLALVGDRVVVPSIADANRFRVQGNQTLLRQLAERRRGNETLEYIRGSAAQAYTTAERVERAISGRSPVGYPQTDLGRRLWQIARMVEADLPARVYAVRLTGFDTHSRQRQAHDALLRQLGDALAAFQRDLKRHPLDNRVLTITYSEFGRRVRENRSLGTDHGAAAPMFAMGARLKGGLHGAHPSLTDLQDGDLRFHTDFRQVYTTILERWLDVSAHSVLGGAFDPVPFL
ncbi:MAG: DUF1501 domain-containing protein [Planctomycetota bacterium]|jgi:uncharacterized protein (DUF1501 family)